MKIFLAASLALLMTGASMAQESAPGTDSVGGGGGQDAANYLAGPNIQQFYTDDTMSAMRPEAEVKMMYDGMSEEDRGSLSTACESNSDPKFEDLCLSLRTN